MSSNKQSAFTIGIEEEVFLLEPDRTSLGSLYFLLKLVLKDPRCYFFHTASNFARGKDLAYSRMSGAEVSTAIHTSAKSAVQDLSRRRHDLLDVVGDRAFVFACGHPVDADTPTNTCALQFHIGCRGREREVWRKLAYFSPLLSLMTANSPLRNGEYFGPSYRMQASFAVGPVTSDPYYRYQDVIISKRLGTVEVRFFDPVWDLDAIEHAGEVLLAIAGTDLPGRDLDHKTLAELRRQAVHEGLTPELRKSLDELSEIISVDPVELAAPFATETFRLFSEHGKEHLYSALDLKYRESTAAYLKHTSVAARSAYDRPPRHSGGSGTGSSRGAGPVPSADRIRGRRLGRHARVVIGILFYYLPRTPYMVYKYLRERPRHGRPDVTKGSE